jgi:hypothetical protein
MARAVSTAGKIRAILNPGRMLSDGIPYPDYAAALEALENDGDWFDFWMEVSRGYEELGTAAGARGGGGRRPPPPAMTSRPANGSGTRP